MINDQKQIQEKLFNSKEQDTFKKMLSKNTDHMIERNMKDQEIAKKKKIYFGLHSYDDYSIPMKNTATQNDVRFSSLAP